MPRGKAWTKAETIALVEAFVHISEDEIIGVNQRTETLYDRVVAEAKTRYTGDWHRGVLACKSRWQAVSKEVQKFIGIDLLIQSVPRSGWNDDDYYKAAVKAYFSAKTDFNMENVEDEDALVFEFKDEWEILKEHQKWQANLSKNEKKRNSGGGSPKSLGGNSENGTDGETTPPVDRPSGTKKAKTIQALTDRTDHFLQELRHNKMDEEKKKDTAVVKMMEHLDARSTANLNKLETIVSTSTDKLANAMTKNTKTKNKTNNMKMLLGMDLSKMSASFQKKAHKAITAYFVKTVMSPFASCDSDICDDDVSIDTIETDSENESTNKK